MQLISLPVGKSAVVTLLSLPPDTVERLSACGLREGAPIMPVRIAPLGSLIAYRVYGTLLAIRPETAAAVTVKQDGGALGKRPARTGYS